MRYLVAFSLLLACDRKGTADWESDCAATCDTLYSADRCNIQSPGASNTELTVQCVDTCAALYGVEGDAGDYTPAERTPATEKVILENQAMAELWMDCIDQAVCEHLSDGYCAPVW